MSLIFPELEEPEELELWSGTAPGFRSRFNSFFASTLDSRFGSTRVQTFVGTCRGHMSLRMKRVLCPHLFFHKGAHLERNLEAFFLRFKIGNLESKGTLIETECAHLLGHIDTVFISLRRALQIWHRLQDEEAIHGGNLPTFLVPFSPG